MAVSDPTVHAAVAALSEATGAPHQLVGRLAGGETGAHEISGPGGERLVLKWDTDPPSQELRRRAAALTERLRLESSWPVPRQDVIEHGPWLLVVQQLLDGGPIDRYTHPLIDQLLDLHDRRLALQVADPDDGWPHDLLHTLVVGGDGYCRHDSLRAYDARTAALVERIEQIGRSLDPADLPGGDVVHRDWHAGNLLQVDGRLSAVVDTDFAATGDARFDLVTLAMSALEVPADPGVQERLERAAFDPLSEAQRSAFVGHLLIRVLDWPIRGGRHDELDLWLSHADRLLTG